MLRVFTRLFILECFLFLKITHAPGIPLEAITVKSFFEMNFS